MSVLFTLLFPEPSIVPGPLEVHNEHSASTGKSLWELNLLVDYPCLKVPGNSRGVGVGSRAVRQSREDGECAASTALLVLRRPPACRGRILSCSCCRAGLGGGQAVGSTVGCCGVGKDSQTTMG